MKKLTLITAVSAALLLPGAAFAQQGTTLAGPAQGSKANGSASTRPSGSGAGANGAATTEGTAAGAGGGALSGGATTGVQGSAGGAGVR